MATTATILSLDEYLQTSYRPDCEYVDGELKERNLGKFDHARVQLLLAQLLANREAEWGVLATTEQRMQVSATRIRIPDLVVMTEQYPPDVLVDPPLLAIEVLSPDDSYSEVQAKSDDYLQMGVPMIWLIDPRSRTARMCDGEQWRAATTPDRAGNGDRGGRAGDLPAARCEQAAGLDDR